MYLYYYPDGSIAYIDDHLPDGSVGLVPDNVPGATLYERRNISVEQYRSECAILSEVALTDCEFDPATQRVSIYQPTDEELLQAARAEAMERLRIQTAVRITGGLTSSALGMPHRYQSALTDQSNLQSALLLTTQPGAEPAFTWDIWCVDIATETPRRRAHTATQLATLATDMAAHIQTAQAAHENVLETLTAATTVEEVEAVALSSTS